jgi:uncharacterized membrane protein YczE
VSSPTSSSSSRPPHDDARFAEVLRFPNAQELRRRLPLLVVGLAFLGLSIAISVRAELGLAPWDVFHQGVSKATHISLGVVIVLVGLVVLLAWIPLRQHLGFGTVLNTLSVGFIANLGLAVIPVEHGLAARIPMLAAAIVGQAVGTGLYIGSGLGPGPRDGLMTAITARGHRLWLVRTTIELSVLVIGFSMGGQIGVGTVLMALTVGPLTHLALRRFHLGVADRVPEVMGE